MCKRMFGLGLSLGLLSLACGPGPWVLSTTQEFNDALAASAQGAASGEVTVHVDQPPPARQPAPAAPVAAPVSPAVPAITGQPQTNPVNAAVLTGGLITLNLTGSFTGGQAPFVIQIFDPNGQLVATANGLVISWVPLISGGSYRIHLTDALGRSVDWWLMVTITSPPIPPPFPLPTVDLKLNGFDNPLPVTASQNGLASVNLSWTSTNAEAITASGSWSGSQAFSGNTTVNDLVPGLHTFRLDVTGPGGSNSDTVSLQVLAAPLPTALTITGVSFSPPSNYHVGQTVTITITTNGATGIIHHLLATSSVVGSVSAKASGVTSFNYIWPLPINNPANTFSFFWPDDKDFAPDEWKIPAQVISP